MNLTEANHILRLTDHQLAIVCRAAVPLSPSARDRYLKPSRPSWRRPSTSMMRPSKPWSRQCSARSSIDDSSETLVARIEDAAGNSIRPNFHSVGGKVARGAKVGDLGIHLMRSFASGMRHERRDGHLRLTLLFVELH